MPKPRRNSSQPAASERPAAEGKIFGRNACLELFRRRPDDIIRVYITSDLVKHFGALLKFCAAKRRAYHVVSVDELSKVSASLHHQGICILAKKLPPQTFAVLEKQIGKKSDACCLLYLDGVGNPHNIGSILRTAAHFGIAGVLGEEGKLPTVSASLARVSEGGAEMVPLVACREPLKDLASLKKAGFTIAGTSLEAKSSIYKQKLPPRIVFVLGAEGEGMSKAIAKLCDMLLIIPGTGDVQSLNVSTASAVLLAEYYRQQCNE